MLFYCYYYYHYYYNYYYYCYYFKYNNTFFYVTMKFNVILVEIYTYDSLRRYLIII